MSFEGAKAALDLVALFVEFTVMRDVFPPIGFGGDNRLHLCGRDEISDGVGVVATVGDHRLGGESLQERRCTLAIGLLTAGQKKTQGASQPITEQMNLGGQSSTGSPHRLLTRPLFPVVAC